MAIADRTTQDKLLKQQWIYDGMRELFSTRSVLLQSMQRDTQTIPEGEALQVPVHKGVTGGIGWSKSDVLPAANYQKVDKATFNYTTLFARIRLSGRHIDSAKTKASAVIKPLILEMTSAIKQARAATSFDMYRDGSGLLSAITSVASATSITATDRKGLINGMKIDVLKDNGTGIGTPAGAGVTDATISITDAGVITLTDGSLLDFTTIAASPADYSIFRAGCYNQAIFGLEAAINTANPLQGNYGNIDRTVAGNDFWKGIMVDQNGAITEEAIGDTMDGIMQNGGECTLMLCDYDLQAELIKLGITDRNFEAPMKYNLWAKAVQVAGVPVVADHHCPGGKIFCLDQSSWRIGQNDAGDWVDDDGAILSRVPDMYQFEAVWRWSAQQLCRAPNQNAVIYGITTS